MEEREDLKERMDLAVERIHQIAANPEVEGPAGDYFKRTAQFMELVLEKKDWKHASLAELQKWNRELYEDIEGEAYEKSFANPSYAVQMLGEGVGQILSFIYTEIRGMIVYAFEGREEELLIHMELFLQIHSEYADGEQPEEERLRKDVYWFMSDYSDVMAAYRVREQVDPSLSFARDIIMGEDLSDPRYLYQFGEYISETELKTSTFLNTLPEEEIRKLASVSQKVIGLDLWPTAKTCQRKRL